MSQTPSLDTIAAHGNRGHKRIANNDIICADGTILSVIAGGGTYSWPRPELCSCDWDPLAERVTSQDEFRVDCDYPGPYSEVEVMTNDPELLGASYMGDDDEVVTVPVETVREYIISHGGEWHADGADDFLTELTKEKE